MLKDHSARLGLLIVVLVLTAGVCSAAADLHKFDGVLQSYFAAGKPSSYYVSVEPFQDGTPHLINNRVFHEWFGLRVSPNYGHFDLEKITSPQIQHAGFVISNNSQEISQAAGGRGEAITITLVDLCKKYFLARPTFLAIEDEDLTMNAVDSPFWEDAECAPEVLLLRDSSEVQKYFAAKKWERKQTIDGFALYLHPSFAAAYSSASTAGTEGQTAAGSDRQALSEVLRLIRKTHPFEAGKSDEELLSVFDINAKLVSIPDIVERASFTRRSKYLLLRGYSAETNVVFIDRTPEHYRLESQQLKDSTLQNITLFGNSLFSHILIPHLSSQAPRIFEQVLKSIKCKKYHIDETVYTSSGSLKAQNKPQQAEQVKEAASRQAVQQESSGKSQNLVLILVLVIIFGVIFFFIYASKHATKAVDPQKIRKGEPVYEQTSMTEGVQGTELKSGHRLELKEEAAS